ncbi:multicopper oxidase family protein [Bacillus subtilis]|nr:MULTISPECIES: multicopper oxidase family protein [Bacillus subtilis group]MEC1901924.1 multicopper oxidase family protein [Bacillus atrophaeus]MEC2235750.1 multicopper oxidase family protein [Bacillus subtilis]MEC2398473.1 multicopper oxidase family protein [Bacillus atrophaeus]MED4306534.1 multicopper oxidase family protein [Bacillus licheniformis]MED4437460.1 multicopper oxidase family protein [Bacillus atrophaeus]
MKKVLIQFFFISLFVFILGACSNLKSESEMDHSNMNTENKEEKPAEDKEVNIRPTSNTEKINKNEFTLTAQERKHTLTDKKKVTAWTFNGSVPGPEIRVKEGENVEIKLKNELPEPVTIHWHGLPVPNNMDGIPGVTMNAVQPGKSFTYEFKATVPGTYWYHSHQNSADQVDKGLYGSLIIEKKNDEKYDKDLTLVLDEWMSSDGSMDMKGMDMGSQSNQMSGMDHGEMNMDSDESESSDNSTGMEHDMSMYDIFTINGKSGKDISSLTVKKGDKVRLRLINAGFMSHKMHLHGHDFKVISTDGQEINNPEVIKGKLLSIAPGERYDIVFTANNPGKWYIECHGEMKGTKGMKALIQYKGFSGKVVDQPNEKETLPVIDFTSYGKKKKEEFTLGQSYDLEYTMDLNTVSKGNELKYTINGKTFPDTENLNVKKGDLVKVKMVNNSKSDDHPMHLHGHFFQVLSKNGKPVQGSPIIKDSINLKPGEEYVVAFKAGNPGNWMFHCHDLHHASAGMVSEVKYEGFKPSFTPSSEANNKPE